MPVSKVEDIETRDVSFLFHSTLINCLLVVKERHKTELIH